MLNCIPRLTALFLCGSVLAGCATTTPNVAKLTGGDTAAGHAKKVADATDKTAPTDLEGGIRQAQLMRLAGHYDEAIGVLSQLMLIASDDPRVVAEYGKTLAEKGRAQDAVEFLNRAIELSSNDWTLYSALGVSYDQLGNQVSARAAYEHALALHPEEASVLNNYALSRMLAGDADGARILIARAQAAGGASDSKIAANITMLNKIAPAPQAPQNAGVAQNIVPVPAQAVAAAAPHPVTPSVPVAQNMPRQIIQQPASQAPQPMPQQRVAMAPNYAQQNGGVVMQAVPFDPLAGPVKGSAKPAAHVAAATPAKADIQPPKFDIVQPAAVKTAAAAKPVKAVPVKTASKDEIPALRMSANAY